MKLHLGCGKRILSGYINIDGANQKADVIHDLTKPLPYGDDTADEIVAIHLFEHFFPDDVPNVLADWRRVLKPGGKLILEMPDIYKSAKNLVAEVEAGCFPSNQWSMFPIYGDCPEKSLFECHKWGWTYITIKPVIEAAGFAKVVERPTEWHGRRENRDFRIEAC